MNVPRYGCYAEESADEGPTTVVDVFGKPEAEVVGEGDTVGGDVGADYCEGPAEGGEELGYSQPVSMIEMDGVLGSWLTRTVVPENCDIQRIPSIFSGNIVYDLRSTRHNRSENTTQSYENHQSHSLRPKNLPRILRIPREIRQIQRKRRLRPNRTSNTLQKHHSHRRPILNLRWHTKRRTKSPGSDKSPNEEREAEYGHDDRFEHEHVS